MSRENDAAADHLERERLRRVPQYRPAFSRDYLDLLDLADAQIRTEDETEERSA